jgi:hypothetical protein
MSPVKRVMNIYRERTSQHTKRTRSVKVSDLKVQLAQVDFDGECLNVQGVVPLVPRCDYEGFEVESYRALEGSAKVAC